VWSTEDGTCLALLKGHTDRMNAIVGFGTGTIFSASDDGSVRQWDLGRVFEGHMAKGPPAEKLQQKMRRRLTENLATVRDKVGALRLRGLEAGGASPRSQPASPKQTSPRLQLTLSGPASPRQRGSLAGLFAAREGESSRLSRSQSVGVVERSAHERAGPERSSAEAPRGSHANFGSSEPLEAAAAAPRAVALLSPRLRRSTSSGFSAPFNVTHTAGGVEKIQTIRSKARFGPSQVELEELQRQLKAEDEWNPNL
jgi:hypothetical protein